MGRWGARIGSHWMEMSDYNLSNLPETSANPDRFNKRMVDLEYSLIDDKEETAVSTEIKMSLTKIIPLKCEAGRYSLDWSKFDLKKTLWKYLMDKGVDVYITPYVVALNHTDPKNSTIYYLAYPYMSMLEPPNEIMLSSFKPAPIKVTSYRQIKWCIKNNLRYDK